MAYTPGLRAPRRSRAYGAAARRGAGTGIGGLGARRWGRGSDVRDAAQRRTVRVRVRLVRGEDAACPLSTRGWGGGRGRGRDVRELLRHEHGVAIRHRNHLCQRPGLLAPQEGRGVSD